MKLSSCRKRHVCYVTPPYNRNVVESCAAAKGSNHSTQMTKTND